MCMPHQLNLQISLNGPSFYSCIVQNLSLCVLINTVCVHDIMQALSEV